MPQKRRDAAVAERFGWNLRRVRRREDLSQEELARRAGLHRNEIGRLEGGERVPRVDTLVRLADSAGVQPVELLEGHLLDSRTRRNRSLHLLKQT